MFIKIYFTARVINIFSILALTFLLQDKYKIDRRSDKSRDHRDKRDYRDSRNNRDVRVDGRDGRDYDNNSHKYDYKKVCLILKFRNL